MATGTDYRVYDESITGSIVADVTSNIAHTRSNGTVCTAETGIREAKLVADTTATKVGSDPLDVGTDVVDAVNTINQNLSDLIGRSVKLTCQVPTSLNSDNSYDLPSGFTAENCYVDAMTINHFGVTFIGNTVCDNNGNVFRYEVFLSGNSLKVRNRNTNLNGDTCTIVVTKYGN